MAEERTSRRACEIVALKVFHTKGSAAQRRFAEEAEKNLAENREALASRNAGSLECNAHKLKSAARTIGAERLADVCVEIEQAARNEDFLILTELLEQKSMLITLLGQQISKEVNQKIQREEAPALED